MQPPSEQQFQEWVAHPVSQALRRLLDLEIEELKMMWAESQFLSADHFQMAVENARAIARCETMRRIRNMTYEEMVGVLDGQE